MTQFALVVVGSDANPTIFRHLARSSTDGLAARASRATFDPGAEVYSLVPFGNQFDDLYLSAQREVADGSKVDATELFRVLEELRGSVAEIALWYGDSFLDLPITSSWIDFCSALAQDINRPSFESYLHFRAESPRVS